jgi:hypothetical protein
MLVVSYRIDDALVLPETPGYRRPSLHHRVASQTVDSSRSVHPYVSRTSGGLESRMEGLEILGLSSIVPN